MLKKLLAFTCLALCFTASFSNAATITGYTYNFTDSPDCDNRCYHDSARSRLRDGVRGSGSAQYNASTGWVGWQDGQPIDIYFSFDDLYSFTQIDFGNLTNKANGSLAFSVYSNEDRVWDLETSGSRSSGRSSITGIDFTTDQIRLSFSSSNDWVLIDEVSFSGSPVVPIPAAAWLFGSALLGLGAMTRKKAI
jgi:hypothetical protein